MQLARRQASTILSCAANDEVLNEFWTSVETGRCIMRNHDLVSGGFLALTVAGLVLLCSSLLTFAFT